MAQDFNHENKVEFWQRAEAANQAEGPFKEQYDTFAQSLSTYKNVLSHEVIDGEQVLSTDLVTFNYMPDPTAKRNKTDSWLQGKAFAYYTDHKNVFDERESRIYLAIAPNRAAPDMMRLKFDKSGIVTNLDDADQSFGETTAEQELLKETVKSLSQNLYAKQYRIKESRAHRRRVIGGTAATLAVVGAIGTGIYLGIEHWHIQPEHRAEAARKLYDSQHHVLTGTSIDLSQTSRVAVLPQAIFTAIPEMKDGDSLLSPRTIKVYGNDCAQITGKHDASMKIVAALQAGDPLEGSNIGVVEDPTHQIMEICLVGQNSPEDSHENRESSRLAVQFQTGN